MARILIVEDEIMIAQGIVRTLKRLGHMPLEPVDNSDDAIGVLGTELVDLVLMDINIEGECDGIATALQVRRQFGTPVVFLTASTDEQTLKRATLVNHSGFITKPYTDDMLRVTVSLALSKANQPPVLHSSTPHFLPADQTASTLPNGQLQDPLMVRMLNSNTSYKKVNLADIHYFETKGNYMLLVTTTGRYMFNSTLTDLLPRLPAYFIRPHRCFIINLNFVEGLEESVVIVGKENIAVSRTYKNELKARLNFLG
ncbi:LytTR family transcriptional regulator DNA-binding domain-containing protein [Hymenobacter sp. J193]|uniref:response regulator n=1 Tax=Hymenobacter sp. J193 TaxID=2898429 RepID=UPI0021515E5B|nr:LytTR family transcriptional regulator DNA-binding domain-containing protein [Hymenobacter sp. J193]MCR5890343.1 LytTR family transcriptional regulator DNA-binding domain-containing protein [Hymenobacter sp. J193]